MALQRKQFWDTRAYHEFIESRKSMPFEWGSNDCSTFSADGIKAITDVDIMAELRGYSDNVGAMLKIHDVTGGTSLTDAVTWVANKYGLKQRTHPLMAQRGDLVLYRNGEDIACGLVGLDGRHVLSPGEQGIERTSIKAVIASWTY